MKHRYFEVAKAVSRLSTFPRIHIGAIVVLDKNIIATGYNKRKTSPYQAKYNKVFKCHRTNFIHAEMDAIKKVQWIDLTKASLYVYREGGGSLRNCKPCQACMEAIKESGIKEIFYTTEEGYFKL